MTVSSGPPLRLAAAALLFALAGCGQPAADTTAAATATSPATPGRDWTAVLAATADGGYRIGNPDADVKLVEYGSVWCPHCREFHEKAMAKLKSDYIATGKVSYELRNFVLNGPDMLATLLVRCDPAPATYWRRLETFYARQQEWEMNFINLKEADLKSLQSLPQEQQMPAYARLAKLNDFVRPQGITNAKFGQCVTNKAEIDRLTASNNRATKDFNLTGTPTFIINGVTLDNTATWETLEPKLKAAL